MSIVGLGKEMDIYVIKRESIVTNSNLEFDAAFNTLSFCPLRVSQILTSDSAIGDA